MSEPTAESVHVNHFMGADKKKGTKMSVKDREALENLVMKRDFTEEQRRNLASEGKALADGSYPIEIAADLKPAAVLARSGHGNVSGAKALIARRAKALGVKNPLEGESEKTDKAEAVQFDVPIWKADREGKVYGVVLAPDREDSQGDVLDAPEIEKACHDFMVESRKADVQHNEVQAGAHVIENYIAPQDLEFALAAGGTEKVVKGSWVQGWQITDPVLKQEVDEGKRTGFSIGGSGVRTPI